MPKELLPLLPDRPPVLKCHGWTIYLSVHDSAYMNTLRTFRARLSEAHPDHGGSGSRFRQVMHERRSWQLREALWYADLNLLPPDGCALAKDKLIRNEFLKVAKRGQRLLTADNGGEV